jgi:hypothetical protein
MEELKTTDGYKLEKHKHYYLENGQEVELYDWMITEDGKMKYLVIPFYEGEAMEVSGDGGCHHEITMPYEHEGLESITNSLFENEPLEKLGERYKSKTRELESLSIAYGNLVQEIKKTESTKVFFTKEIETIGKSLLKYQQEEQEAKDALEKLKDDISAKRSELSHLEDSINDLSPEYSSEELAKLRKRDFKLTCLENGGVDNWEWFGESLNDYSERYPDG